MHHRILPSLSFEQLDLVAGGMNTDGFRPSENVEDRRNEFADQYSITEDGLYDHYSAQAVDDPGANMSPGGYRDDPTSGDRTWIDGNGETTGVERGDGSFDSRYTPVEDGMYDRQNNSVGPDPYANTSLGGYSDGEDGSRTYIGEDGSTGYVDPTYQQDNQAFMNEMSDLTQGFGQE